MCDANPLEGDRVAEGVQGGFEKVFGNDLLGNLEAEGLKSSFGLGLGQLRRGFRIV